MKNIIGVTGRKLIANNQKIMNDPEIQKRLAVEFEAKGLIINFDGPIPSIGTRNIHVSSALKVKE